jgi:dTDP-4-amino-4,6-dideoxygalactose transaminase
MVIDSTIPILNLEPEITELWDELNDAVQRVLRSGQFIMGPEVRAFEEEIATYLGTRNAIGVNSGTDALVIALRAAGIGPGDEVITTPFSFFATAESISAVGATPVFADVDQGSFNLDPCAIEPLVTSRTRAIMPVHLYGRPADMDRLLSIAEHHGLMVIEDCAQSFGARYISSDGDDQGSDKGRMVGTMGTFGCYSFFPSKNLGAFGDGGLIVTDDDVLAERARMLRSHGSKKKYYNELIGYNSRLDEVQAAVLRVKLPHLEGYNAGRRRVAEAYDRLLDGVAGVVTPAVSLGHVFHQYTVRIEEADRDAIARALHEQGIVTMVYYPTPINRLPVYVAMDSATPVSDLLAERVLSLPIWPGLREETQRRVADALRNAVDSLPSGQR